jgi:glycosyltransferase involved in cell wall biosynthesis
MLMGRSRRSSAAWAKNYVSDVRVAVVSAHYPPNFVSGGTLQPQRIARGLQARGHDVHVYAGHLDDARPPLETWEEDDGHGIRVHWIVITPFVSWSDRQNFDNPSVVADFRAWLARVEPDVVHLHSLQTLGGELVAAAKDAGAAVVVTMHDFWWVCARQFLVDHTFTPCSLVVDAGVCPCEVTREWADARLRALQPWLARADAVLAPSAPAAAVLVANGIDAEVDENGLLVEELVQARASTHADVTRFTYAGGHLEMKGVHVVLGAARRLAAHHGRDGWSLTAYGAAAHIAERGIDLGDLPVTVPPSFTPDALGDVLASTDVLVLPSVMRETHSLLAREALLAGVPVITSDSLGPEEVVVDGENGMVVPTGDVDALAEAMWRVVDDRELLRRLRDNARTRPVAVRPIEEQVRALEARYERLRRAAPSAPSSPSSREAEIQRVLFVVGIEGAPLRYRARLPAEALASLDVASDVVHYRDDRLPALAGGADVVVVYRVPATHQILDLIDRTRRRGVPVLFDVDDLIFDPDIAEEIPALRLLPPDEAALWLEGVRRYRTTLEHCDGYVGSTPMLVRHEESVVGLPAALFENGVGRVLAQHSDAALRRPRRDGPLRIGYFSGTTTHDDDWRWIEPAVATVMAGHPELELWLGGHLPDTPALAPFSSRIRRLPFMDWCELPSALRDLDVNLAPLEPHGRFNEAKSAIKWLEAALCATPTIATPTEPFVRAIDARRNGMLATDPGEWVAALTELLDDDLLRARLGSRARRDALLEWSHHRQGARYLEILRTSREWVAAPDHSRPRSWVDVAHDEPFMAIGLEPYERGSAPLAAPPPAPAPTLAAKLRHSLRHNGVMGTARRAVRRVLPSRGGGSPP